MARLFIGIFVPENFKPKIFSLQKEIEKLPLQCKFVEEENLHISFSFLGETPENEIPNIEEKLDAMAKTYQKFDAEVSGIKLIPSKNYVRVIALDVHNGILKTISQHIKQDIGGDVKPPHLTLCRVKSVTDKKAFGEKIFEINSDLNSFLVESIDLIQSKLQRTGPVYTSLHKSLLL